MQQLETVVIETYQPSFERQSPYHAQDLGSLSSVALYSGPIGRIGSGPLFGSEHFGCLSGSGPTRPAASRPVERVSPDLPHQIGYDMGGGYQVKFKGPDETTLAYGKLVRWTKEKGSEKLKEFNGYECSTSS